VRGKRAGIPCEIKVIRRILAWWEQVLPYYLGIVKSLSEKYRVELVVEPAFKEIVRAAANSNNWIFAGIVCTRSASLSPGGV
jgi:hypothetical protein